MLRLLFVCAISLLLGGCPSGGLVSGGTGERELRPPRAGIEVGSLYYVRETPTADLSKPANLERLCSVSLAQYGIVPKTGQRVADIDLLEKTDLEGSLEGLKTQFASLGLSGNLNNYFEYKLVNVTRSDISLDEAQKIYQQRAFRSDCSSWRGSVAGNNWGIYQIQSISEGDVTFAKKNDFGASAEVSAKIASLEPKLKAALKAANHTTLSGKGLVATFGPIPRNLASN